MGSEDNPAYALIRLWQGVITYADDLLCDAEDGLRKNHIGALIPYARAYKLLKI
jgi:hypothetical protein